MQSKPHPSRRKVKRDINNKILYNDDNTKKTIAVTFVKNMDLLHKDWVCKNDRLIKIHSKTKLSYNTFIRFRPSHIVKQTYLALMACDTCHIFQWYRNPVDKILKDHECTLNSECIICIALEIDNNKLISELCCKGTKSYLDKLIKLPDLGCAHNKPYINKCTNCVFNIYEQIFSNKELISTNEDKVISIKRLQRGDSVNGTKQGKIPIYDDIKWSDLKREFINNLKQFIEHNLPIQPPLKKRRILQTVRTIPIKRPSVQRRGFFNKNK